MGAVLTPDVGSPILPTDPVVFDLTDATETLTSILITVRHDSGLIELAHDGTNFTSFFVSGSTRTVITDGYHYSLIRAGGWVDTKVVVSAFPFAGTGVGLINFSSDFGVLDDPPGEDVALSVTGVSAGSYGNSAHVGSFTTDSKGRLTAAASVTIVLTDNSGSSIAHVGSGGSTGTNVANINDVNSAVGAEATLRAAADALIPGTITALTAGDGTASGTGAVPFTLTNLPQAVLLTRLAALAADPAFNNRKLTLLADGVALSDAATVGQVAASAFTVANNAALVATDDTKLGDGASRRVTTYRAWFDLNKTSTLTLAADEVLATNSGTGRWVRRSGGDPFWTTVTNWTVDPSGGSDEGATTVKTRSEIARRVRGQGITQNTNIQINGNLLSTDITVPTWAAANGPFGNFGFAVTYTGVPVSVYAGAITITQVRSGVAGQQTFATAVPAWNPTTLLNKIVEWTDGSGHFTRARICKDMGSGVAWLSAPLRETYAEGTFANGSTVNVWTLPSLSGEEELSQGGSYIQNYNYIAAPRWIAPGQTQCLLTNCEGPTVQYGGNLGVANHFGPTISSGGQTQVYGGKIQLIAAGAYYRISVTPSCYTGNESHAALQCEGAGLIITTGTAGGAVMADIECVDTAGAINCLAAFAGARVFIEGYTYGTLTGTNVIIMGARSATVSLKRLPNFSVTGVNFVEAGIIGSTADLATKSLDDIYDNRVIGPAGPTLNDNRSQPIAHLGSGGATRSSAANIGDVQDGLAAAAFGVANAAALVAIDTTTLSSGIWRWVATYKAWFYLDKASTLTADPDRVLAATTGGGFWLRDESSGHPTWQAQMAVYIDPAGTHSPPGNNEADGSSGTPIKSMSEWRRRNKGAVWDTTAPVIRLLSGSTVLDDGIIDGVSTPNSTVFLTILGTPTVLFSGTVSSYQPYAGNTRGTFVDTALSTWTSAGGISTTTGGRFVRKQGTGARPQGPLIKDIGAKTAMFDILGNWDETATGLAFIPTEVNLANGDTYEVCSVPVFPFVQPVGNVNVRAQCLEIQTKQLSGVLSATPSPIGGSLTFVLCSFGRGVTMTAAMGKGDRFYSCVFSAISPEGTGTSGNAIFAHCAWINSILELSSFNSTTTGVINVMVGSEFRWWHGNQGGSVAEWRIYDTASPVISARHDSTINIVGPITGSGNTGALINVDSAGIVYGGQNVTAATSSLNPYIVSGVAYPAPKVDARTGDAIYNATSAQFLVPDAVDNQAAVPLHQVVAIAAAVAVGIPVAGHAAQSILGNPTGSTGNAVDIALVPDTISGRAGTGNVGGIPMTAAGRAMAGAASATAQTVLLDLFTPTAKGLAPAGTGAPGTFLAPDGGWSVPSGTGPPLSSTSPADVTKSAAVTGTGTTSARADHKHDVSTATAGTLAVGASAAEGVAASLARSDHQHAIPRGTPADVGTTNAAGTSTSFAGADHVHALTFPPVRAALAAASSSIDVGGQQVVNAANPTVGNALATKDYVDTLLNGLKWKAPVRAASTGNVNLATLANGSVQDGVTLATGDRFAAKDQTTGSESGVYLIGASGPATRAPDADTGTELVSAVFFVMSGTVNADHAFVCTNDAITLGTTAITFVEFVVSDGALLKANNLSDLTNVPLARTNLGLAAIAASGSASDLIAGTVPAARMPGHTGDATSSAGSVVLTLAASGVTAGSYGDSTHVGNLTVDAKGRVTAAASTAIALGFGDLSGALQAAQFPGVTGVVNVAPGGFSSQFNAAAAGTILANPAGSPAVPTFQAAPAIRTMLGLDASQHFDLLLSYGVGDGTTSDSTTPGSAGPGNAPFFLFPRTIQSDIALNIYSGGNADANLSNAAGINDWEVTGTFGHAILYVNLRSISGLLGGGSVIFILSKNGLIDSSPVSVSITTVGADSGVVALSGFSFAAGDRVGVRAQVLGQTHVAIQLRCHVTAHLTP